MGTARVGGDDASTSSFADIAARTSRRYSSGMTDRYPLSDKQVFGSDVDDDDMDAILDAMDKLDAEEPKSEEKQ